VEPTAPTALPAGSAGQDPLPVAAATPRRGLLRKVLWGVGIVAVAAGLVYVLFGVGLDNIFEHILNLPAWLIVFLAFLLPALEASIFIGVVLPGEIAVFLGGVAASRGSAPLAAVLIAACLGAVLGDQVGYWVGREWGAQVLSKIPDRILDDKRLEQAQGFVRRTGAKGVVIGRWTAALRALVPGLAGMARMHYPRFLIANIIGGVAWAVTVVLLGYYAGNQYKAVQARLGQSSSILLAVIVVGFIAWHFIKKHRERKAG
jgi:membrane-associated protein